MRVTSLLIISALVAACTDARLPTSSEAPGVPREQPHRRDLSKGVHKDAIPQTYVLISVDGVALPVGDLSGRGAWDYDGWAYWLESQTIALFNDGTFEDVQVIRVTHNGMITNRFTETYSGRYQRTGAWPFLFTSPCGSPATTTQNGMVLHLCRAFLLTFEQLQPSQKASRL